MKSMLVAVTSSGEVPGKQVDLSTQTISEDTVLTQGFKVTASVVVDETVTIDDAATVTIS